MREREESLSGGDSLGSMSSKWDALGKLEWKNERQQQQRDVQQEIQQQNREQDKKYADRFADNQWFAKPSADALIENRILSPDADQDTIQTLTEVEKGRPEPVVREQKIGNRVRRVNLQLQSMHRPQK